jgi:hypothetical protein
MNQQKKFYAKAFLFLDIYKHLFIWLVANELF